VNIGINKDSPITDDKLIARFSVREAIERGKTMTILKKWRGGACEKLVYLQTSCRKGRNGAQILVAGNHEGM